MILTKINNNECKRGSEILLNEPPNKRARVSDSEDESLAETSPPSSNDAIHSPEGYHLLSVRTGIDWQNSKSLFSSSSPLFDLDDDLFEGEELFASSDPNDQEKWRDEHPSPTCHTPLFDEQSSDWDISSETSPLNEGFCTPPRNGCCTPPPSTAHQTTYFSPKTKRSFRQSNEVPCLHIQNATQINAFLRAQPFQPFLIEVGKEKVVVTQCVRELSIGSESGAFSDVFLVNIESPALSGVSQCVLKIPNARYRETKNKTIQNMLASELYQYSEMKKEFNCIARHYDFDLLEQQGLYELQHVTYGCHLVEYVPDPYPVGDKEAHLSQPGSLKFNSDMQLQKIFQQAYEKSIPLDLSLNNTRLLNGRVKCIDPWDPLVQPLEFDEEPFSFEKLIPTFAPAESQRATFLDPSKTRNSH